MKINPHKAWRGLTPRRWQKEALPCALSSLRARKSSLVVAVMGAGKSFLVAEVINCVTPSRGSVIILAAPKLRIMRDLAKDVARRIGADNVGLYYSKKKDSSKPVICTTYQSLQTLAEELRGKGARVDLLLCDEAHRTETEDLLDTINYIGPAHKLGLTATPYRDSSRERLSLWKDGVCYHLTVDDALADGIIVPWDLRTWSGSSMSVDDAAVEMVKEAVREKQGAILVNADSIEDAENFALILDSEGIRAEAIHSELSDEEQETLIQDLKEGRLDALVHVSLLTEGVNLPWLRTLVLRRGNGKRSRVAFAQEVGRVLRACPEIGKTNAIIYDPMDLFRSHALTYPEAVGGASETPRETGYRRGGGGSGGGESGEPREAPSRSSVLVRSLNQRENLLRKITSALETCGALLPLDRTWSEEDARTVGAETLIRIGASGNRILNRKDLKIPASVARGLAEIYADVPVLPQGHADDFLRILEAIDRGGWPPNATILLRGSGARR